MNREFWIRYKKPAVIAAVIAVICILLAAVILNNRAPEEETDYVDISEAFRQDTALKSYEYRGDDKLLRLVYTVENDIDKTNNGFKVTSVKLHDYRAESNMLTLYATVLSESYIVNGDTIELENASIVPKAYIFTADTDLSAISNPADYDIAKLINSPVEIIQAKDGSYYKPSVEDFCITPVTREEIKGLADKILTYDSSELTEMQKEHFDETLKSNNYTITRTYKESAVTKYKISNK